MKPFVIGGLILSCFVAWSEPSFAQPRPSYAPSSTHIYPAGGQRGTSVAVLVGTECAPPATRFSIFGEGVTAHHVLGEAVLDRGEPSPRRNPTETPITYPREWKSNINISEDATPGAVFWQLNCAQGGTASRPFIIGALPEYLEVESNSRVARAEPIDLPVTVNGRINGERDVDYFRFSASAGQTISCEMLARRIGSSLDPLMQVLDGSGQAVPVDETHVGNDPVLVLRAQATGDYLLRIANVTKHGNPANVYRVNLTTKPYVRYAFPASGRVGQTESIDLLTYAGDGVPQPSKIDVSFPETEGPFQFQSNAFSGSIQLVADDLSHGVEDQANETRESATELTIPQAIDGRLEQAHDIDWFSFLATADVEYSIVCQPLPVWDACLPTLVVADESGKAVARQRSVESDDGVARIFWRADAAGRYFVRVRDQQYRVAGGPNFVYRLTVRPAEPDFELRLASDNLDVMPGETTTVTVKVVRYDGFMGPVQLRFADLPAGVTMESAQVGAKQSSTKIKLHVAKGIPLDSHVVSLVGHAKIGGQAVQRVAVADHSGVDSQGLGVGPARLSRMQLTVRHAPLFRLYCAEAYQYAHRGSIYPYEMEIERLNGFDGEVVLQIGDRQNRDLDGIEMIETVVPPGQSKAILPIYLPETMHINIQSQSQLYSQGFALFTDRRGTQQSQLILSEKRNMLRTLPPVVKLVATNPTVSAAAGEEALCHLRLDRTSNFPGPMRLELRCDSADARIQFEPLMIAAGETHVSVPLQIAEGCVGGSFNLTFRATGQMTASMQAVTEADVQVVVEAEGR